jgi:glycine cleavage system aminomethyltransferase T
LGVNNFSNFRVDKAKQFIAVNHDGFLIGDAILFYLADDRFDLVGHPMVLDWVQFNVETGGYRVDAVRDDNSIVRQEGPPKLFRYELQGPTAVPLLEKLHQAALPEIRFFNMGRFNIAGREVRALRHGMAGQPGFELFGPWKEGERVREALLEAGDEFNLVPVGAKAYSTANLESGWVPSPLPAIFTGDAMRPYRQWLSAASAGSLGGSFRSDDVVDYYLTPFDLGYGPSIAFDHDFVGSDALQAIASHAKRTKVTLVWNRDDVAAAIATLFGDADAAKYIDLPKSRYALYQVDSVLVDGEPVGVSHDCGYIANERAFVSLASLDVERSKLGSEVNVVWGEAPNSSKPQVEPHKQVEIRAIVAPAPYVQFARSTYRAN